MVRIRNLKGMKGLAPYARRGTEEEQVSDLDCICDTLRDWSLWPVYFISAAYTYIHDAVERHISARRWFPRNVSRFIRSKVAAVSRI